MALLSSMDIAILTIVHGSVAGCHGEAPNALLNIDLTKHLWPFSTNRSNPMIS